VLDRQICLCACLCFVCLSIAQHALTSAQVSSRSRDAIESNLEFLSLIVLENKVKPETAGALAQLAAANIRAVMVTGDNALTASSVARECGMVGPTDTLLVARVMQRAAGAYELVFESDGVLGARLCESEGGWVDGWLLK
jgi:magnesium-transporting ATPase (P-type)